MYSVTCPPIYMVRALLMVDLGKTRNLTFKCIITYYEVLKKMNLFILLSTITEMTILNFQTTDHYDNESFFS